MRTNEWVVGCVTIMVVTKRLKNILNFGNGELPWKSIIRF